MHATAAPSLTSATVRMPLATARSPHLRSADQNAALCVAEQKRFGEPPRRVRKGRPHQLHAVEVALTGGSAVAP